MNVAQLIKELKKYPPEAEVTVSASYDCGYAEAGGKIDRIITYSNPLTDKITEVELHTEEDW